MNSKALVIALIVSIGINVGVIGTVAYRLIEGRQFRSHLHERLWRHSPLKRDLKLTDEQLDEMDRMREEMREKVRPLREQLGDRRRELIDLLRADEPDRSKLDPLAGEIADLQSELGLSIFEHLLEMREILSEEQREKILELFERELHRGEGIPGPFGHEPPARPGPPPKHHGF
jgi:Spy/CpxP family protein refolding chaperone